MGEYAGRNLRYLCLSANGQMFSFSFHLGIGSFWFADNYVR